jgi:hypothetical protein
MAAKRNAYRILAENPENLDVDGRIILNYILEK